MDAYDTVVSALKGLKERGYTRDFNLAFDKIQCSQTELCLDPGQFEIIEVFRFDGDTNPDDEDIVYAVASKDGKIKGTITSAYGVYADGLSNEMIHKLSGIPSKK